MKDFMACWQIHDAVMHIISVFSILVRKVTQGLTSNYENWQKLKPYIFCSTFQMLLWMGNIWICLSNRNKWVYIYFWRTRCWLHQILFHLVLLAAGNPVEWTDLQKQSTFCWVNIMFLWLQVSDILEGSTILCCLK